MLVPQLTAPPLLSCATPRLLGGVLSSSDSLLAGLAQANNIKLRRHDHSWSRWPAPSRSPSRRWPVGRHVVLELFYIFADSAVGADLSARRARALAEQAPAALIEALEDLGVADVRKR